MKLLAGLFLLVIFLSSTPNRLRGGFINESEGKEGYYFWEKYFSWFRIKNGTIEYGNGSFKLVGDSITLEFGPARKQFDIAESIERSTARGQEAIKVSFTTEQKEPIEGLEVKLNRSGMKSVTNSNGIAVLNTGNSRINNDRLDIQFGNYRTYWKSVSLKRHTYDLKIIDDKRIKYKENQTHKFKFRVAGNKLEIVDNEVRIDFRRVTRWHYMNLYHRVDWRQWWFFGR
jgi:hypothetical protein